MLKKEVQYIKGVGPAKAKSLAKIGVNTLKDLIEYYPRDYEDRTKVSKIINLSHDSHSLIHVVLVSNVTSNRIKRMTIQKATFSDETGKINVTWFNQPYLVNQLKTGKEYFLYGQIKQKYASFEMLSPEVEEIDSKYIRAGNILPIYSLTKGLKQNALRIIMQNALETIKNESKTSYIYEDIFTKEFLKQKNLLSLEQAIHNIHFPVKDGMQNLARRRLAFEELFITTLMLARLKLNNEKEIGPIFNKDIKVDEIIDKLPYKLTNAQIRVLNEIEKDLESDKSMNRLLQGDVGSGKTIISIIASYKAVKSGYQVAMLVPTAILAVQHFDNFKNNLEKYGIRIGILRSGLRKKEKEEIIKNIKNGNIDIVIGTHALLEEEVEFKKLGLVITDEQHRFGVKQREAILAKGINSNTLVMSATPIPRTLALILYGDLDISIIDELPPNRKEVKTYLVNYTATNKIYSLMRKVINEGRQVYVVCPLIEENEELDLNSVEKIYEIYKKEFKENTVSFIHGKMKEIEKDQIMLDFKEGRIDILVSTTVIEVGVDVPNANLMIIENAERFGLAQLHQLRGRVGRGDEKSFCILKTKGGSEITKERLEIMEKTTDGFVISEKDLELRGSGDFFGTKQHGIQEFKIANLFTDIKLLEEAQNIAKNILKEDPYLEKEENIKIGNKIKEILEQIIL